MLYSSGSVFGVPGTMGDLPVRPWAVLLRLEQTRHRQTQENASHRFPRAIQLD